MEPADERPDEVKPVSELLYINKPQWSRPTNGRMRARYF
jgi:hypothetical protein